jgi:hypothetical protein
VGTGKWEEYAYVVYCGNTGLFQTAGYVSMFGTGAWSCYIAASNVYEINSPGILNLTPVQVAKGVRRGTVTLNFGAWPGTNEASYVFTGQTEWAADSVMFCDIAAVATANHTANDAAVAAQLIGLSVGTSVAGVGPTVFARSIEKLEGQFTVNYHWH